jgi:seryl-tRNA synthetase
VHQFDKVEIIQMVHPDKSYGVLEEMVNHVEKLLNLLELPYRILRLCGGDMSFTSALTYDFEVYSAAQQKWLEVSSVSNFETFQTNRMKIRYKDEAGKTQLLHSLNGSSLALPRIVAALLENNQSEKGIHLPQILHKYFGKESIDK